MRNIIEVMKSEVDSLTKVTSKLQHQTTFSGYHDEEMSHNVSLKLRNFYVQIA
jgi:hypothetical protein